MKAREDFRGLKGKRFGELTAEMQKEVEGMISGTYFGTGFGIDAKAPTAPGEYPITVDLENGLSIAGTYIVTEDEVITEINDDGIFN